MRKRQGIRRIISLLLCLCLLSDFLGALKIEVKAGTTHNPNATVMPTPAEYADLEIQKRLSGNYIYSVTSDTEFLKLYNNAFMNPNRDITLLMGNDYKSLYFPRADMDDIIDNYKYLKYFGEIKAYDANGNDVSNSILIHASIAKVDQDIYMHKIIKEINY